MEAHCRHTSRIQPLLLQHTSLLCAPVFFQRNREYSQLAHIPVPEGRPLIVPNLEGSVPSRESLTHLSEQQDSVEQRPIAPSFQVSTTLQMVPGFLQLHKDGRRSCRTPARV